MRISQIAYTGFGGLGSVIFSLITADHGCKNNWSIGFIGDQELYDEYASLCNHLQVPYAAFQSKPGKPYRAWIALARWLDYINPEVVICHTINSILACRWYAWRNRSRLIAVEHTPNQVKTRRERAASFVSMLVADRVVVLTDDYREELRKAHGLLYNETKVRVIPNGVDTQLFRPVAKLLQTERRVIRLGMAARFSFSKRQDLLVEVMGELANLRPNLSFEIWFAGDGEELQRVQAVARCSPVATRIHFCGLLSEPRVAEWLKGLDIYVHATDGETLSTSLLQAMSTGLPIVASDIPGVANLLGANSEFGLCSANEALTFAHTILNVIDSVDLSADLGYRARAQILANYSRQVMLQRYLDVIAECLR